jgi:uncharacterized membrane protein
MELTGLRYVSSLMVRAANDSEPDDAQDRNEQRAPSDTAWQSEERRESTRLEALSDGVFAVALTLLIFSVHTPDLTTLTWSKLASASVWQSVLTYIISFLSILVMWVNHHSVFRFIVRIDRAFIYLNGGLLLLIVFVNYPTSLVATYAATSGAGVAAAVYSATLVMIAVFYNALWRWASSGRRLITSDAAQSEVDRITAEYRFGPLLYLIAFGVAFWYPWLSIGINAALAIYFAFTGQISRSRA